MAKKNEEKKREPLEDRDIIEAMENAGYSFEVRLFYQFKEAGLDPVIGHRFPVADEGDYREVDLLASTHAREGSGNAEQKAIIQAKKLHDPHRFVGVLGEQPTEHEQLTYRAREPAGLPSRGHIERIPCQGLMQLLLGPGGFGEAYEPWLGLKQVKIKSILPASGERTARERTSAVLLRAVPDSDFFSARC